MTQPWSRCAVVFRLDRASPFVQRVVMQMTIDIPEKELEEAMAFLRAKSEQETVLMVLHEFNRKHRMARLIRFSGSCDFDDNAALEQAEASELRIGQR